jgi:putative restriction endonuclease
MPDATESALLSRLAKLKIDKAKGDPAPHMPLLLLAVMDLIESGQIVTNPIRLSAELTYQFLTYWRVVAHRRKAAPDIRMPFHHLKGSRFWEPLDAEMKPSPDRRLTQFANVSDSTFAMFQDSVFREQARRVLIVTYFLPSEQIALASTLGIPESDLGAAALAIATAERDTAIQKGRDVKFRLVVVSAYSFTCCLTRHRLTTISRGSMVDAAHIHQFADSRNNDPRNGLALSKNAHWMFDLGLWTIKDDFTIRVARTHFTEDNPHGKGLADYDGTHIFVPADPMLKPDPLHLAWHRDKKFLDSPNAK